jgi:hypothetical protein
MPKNSPKPDPPFPKEKGGKLDVAALKPWLWEAACVIRGPLGAPKFRDYILPLICLKQLSDVFDDEIARLGHEFGDEATAAKLDEQDKKLVRFFMPKTPRWSGQRLSGRTGLQPKDRSGPTVESKGRLEGNRDKIMPTIPVKQNL